MVTPTICHKTTKLNNGASIPLIALGTYKAAPDECYDAVIHALEFGYRHIDTARIYRNEVSVGRAVNDFLKSHPDVKRSDLFITTKICPCDYRNPEFAIQCSLERLQLDYVDMYLMHHSLAMVSGEGLMPADENGNRKYIPFEEFSYIDAFKLVVKLVEKGYTKAVGVCNFNLPKIKRLVEDKNLAMVPAINQCEIHPYLPESELVEYCQANGVVIEAYSPLGSTGAPVLKEPVLIELAKKYEVSPACIVISWSVARNIVVLPKSVTSTRIDENIKVIEMSTDDIKKINDICKKTSKRYLNPNWGIDVYGSDAEFKPIN